MSDIDNVNCEKFEELYKIIKKAFQDSCSAITDEDLGDLEYRFYKGTIINTLNYLDAKRENR